MSSEISRGRLVALHIQCAISALQFTFEMVLAASAHGLTAEADAAMHARDAIILGSFLAYHFIGSDRTLRNTYGWLRVGALGDLIATILVIALGWTLLPHAIEDLVKTEEIEDKDINLLLIVSVTSLMVRLASFALAPQLSTEDSELFTENSQNAFKKIINGILHISPSILPLSLYTTIYILRIYFRVSRYWIGMSDQTLGVTLALINMWRVLPCFLQRCRLLMQNIPQNVDIEKLKLEIKRVDAVENVHELHLWQLGGQRLIAHLHVRMERMENFMNCARIIKMIMHTHGIHSCTIQPEQVDKLTSLSKDPCLLACPEECAVKTCCNKDINPFYDIPVFRRRASSINYLSSQLGHMKRRRTATHDVRFDSTSRKSSFDLLRRPTGDSQHSMDKVHDHGPFRGRKTTFEAEAIQEGNE